MHGCDLVPDRECFCECKSWLILRTGSTHPYLDPYHIFYIQTTQTWYHPWHILLRRST